MSEERELTLSDGERLITHMLCELYKHLKIEGEIGPGFVQSALFGGHYWGLEWKYPGLFHSHKDNPTTVTEVTQVLNLWSYIERSHQELSRKDRERIEKEAAPFGKDVRFRGFDGNYESEHLGVAGFLIDELDRFAEFKVRDLNSHAPLLEAYRRMLTVFEPMLPTLAGGHLSAAQIIKLLEAMHHHTKR